MSKFVVMAAFVLMAVSSATAQVAVQGGESTVTLAGIGMFIYPAEGQSSGQQRADEAACMYWAETQTGLSIQAGGVDTQGAAAAAGQQAAGATQGAAVAGAARGALGGLAIGAIAGDAGTGAAIGAAAGAIGGRRARRQATAQASQAGAAQADAQNAELLDSFRRAAAVCLEGRGYTVQ